MSKYSNAFLDRKFDSLATEEKQAIDAPILVAFAKAGIKATKQDLIARRRDAMARRADAEVVKG